MKKILLTVAFAFFWIFNINAQEKGSFELGTGIGLSSSSVSDMEGDIETSEYLSFNIGVSGEYYFSDRWGAKVKIIYDNKGWGDATIFDDDFNIVETDVKLSYITIPMMANWHFGKKRNWYLNFGPYVGFLTKAEDSTLSLDLKDDFESTDAGLALGIGCKFNVGETAKLYIEYDGQFGMSDIFTENIGDPILNTRGGLNVGFLFGL